MSINEGDKVYIVSSETTGRVQTVYPELQIAIVKTAEGVSKVRVDELVRLSEEAEDPKEVKKDSLLDKVKGRFKK